MALDLSKLTDDELLALSKGDMSKLSDGALYALAGVEAPKPEKPFKESYREVTSKLPEALQGAIGGYEAAGSMLLNLPSMVEGYGRKLYSHMTESGTEEEKRQKANEAASKTWLPQVHPVSEMGQKGEELLSIPVEKFVEGAGNLGAKFVEGQTFLNDPKLKNTGEVEKKYGKEGIEAGRTFGQLGAEGLLVAPLVKGGVKGSKNLINKFKKDVPAVDTDVQAFAEERAKKQQKAVQKQPEQMEMFYKPTEEEIAAELNQKRAEQILRDNRLKAQYEVEGMQRDLAPGQLDMFNPDMQQMLHEAERGNGKGLPFTDLRMMEEAQQSARNRPDPMIGEVQEQAQRTLQDVDALQRGEQERAGTYPEQVPDNSINWQSPKQMEIEQLWSEKQAQELAAQQASKEIAWQRADAEKAPLELEPSQRSVEIESPQERTTYRPNSNKPLGQTGFGKGQRGSIGFFGKDPFEKYAEKIREKFPDATPEEIKAGWDRQQAKLNEQKIGEQKLQALKKTLGGGLDPKLTGDVIPMNEFVQNLVGVPDIETPSLGKQKFRSSGRLQRDAFDHPVTTQIYNLTTKAVESAREAARNILDTRLTGIFPRIHAAILTPKLGKLLPEFDGAKQMRDYVKWRHENEGSDAPLPAHFNKNIRDLHEAWQRGDKQLLGAMNEVLAAEGKKPIHDIPNHMVHYWKGPYRAYIKVNGSNGNRISTFISENTKGEAEAAVRWFKKNMPDVEFVNPDDPVSFTPTSMRQRSAMFDHLLELQGKDPSIAATLDSIFKRVEESQSIHRSEHNRQKYRSGRIGFIGNKPWLSDARNYADALDTVRTKFDAGFEWVAMQKVRQEMQPLLDAQKNGDIQVGKAITLGQRYIDHAFGKNLETSPITKGLDFVESQSPKFGTLRRSVIEMNDVLNKLTIPMALGFLKTTNLVQQGIQPVIAIPKMLDVANQIGGSYKIVPVAFAKGTIDGLFALTDAMSMGMSRPLMEKMSSPVTKQIWDYMDKHDVTRLTLTDNRPLFSEGGTLKTAANIATDVVLNKVTGILEGPSRAWTFSSFTHQFLAEGHPIETALKMAHEQMDVMTNYNPEAGAMILSDTGLIGHEAKGLHNFTINYYSQMFGYWDTAMKGIKKGSPKDAAPLLSFMAVTAALGGTLGFFGEDVAEYLLDIMKNQIRGTQFDNPEFQRFDIRKWQMDNFPDWLHSGLVSTMSGRGLYGAFSSKVLDPNRTVLETIFPKTMIKANLLKNLARTPELLNEDTPDVVKGDILSKIAPAAFTQRIRNEYAVDDGKTLNKETGLPMYQRTQKEQEIATSRGGIRSLSEALNTEDAILTDRGEQAATESRNARMKAFESYITDSMKKKQFNPERFNELYNELVEKWHVDENTLNAHVEQVVKNYGASSKAERDLMNASNVGFSNYREVQEKAGLLQRMKQRQERYGK